MAQIQISLKKKTKMDIQNIRYPLTTDSFSFLP